MTLKNSAKMLIIAGLFSIIPAFAEHVDVINLSALPEANADPKFNAQDWEVTLFNTDLGSTLGYITDAKYLPPTYGSKILLEKGGGCVQKLYFRAGLEYLDKYFANNDNAWIQFRDGFITHRVSDAKTPGYSGGCSGPYNWGNWVVKINGRENVDWCDMDDQGNPKNCKHDNTTEAIVSGPTSKDIKKGALALRKIPQTLLTALSDPNGLAGIVPSLTAGINQAQNGINQALQQKKMVQERFAAIQNDPSIQNYTSIKQIQSVMSELNQAFSMLLQALDRLAGSDSSALATLRNRLVDAKNQAESSLKQIDGMIATVSDIIVGKRAWNRLYDLGDGIYRAGKSLNMNL